MADESREPKRETGGSRILVVRVGALGDTLMATPVLRALRSTHTTSSIDFLAAAAAAPLLQLNPGVDSLLSLRRRNLPYAISSEKQRLADEIGARRYRFAVLLESAPKYRRLLERAGVDEIMSFEEAPFQPSLHSSANNLRVAGFLDWQAHSLDLDLFYGNEHSERTADMLLRVERPIVGIHAGYGPAHRKSDMANRLRGWPTESFQELIGRILDSGVSVILTGSREDRQETSRIGTHFEGRQGFLSLAGSTSVLELAALIARLDLFVSVDSGPAHMAAAVGTPLLVLWGPGILAQTRPMSTRSPITILHRPVPCAPCYGTPLMRSCRDNVCMKSIPVDEVYRAAEKLLNKPAQPL